jgi:conserved oligomeric Golgi complex subunit 6
MNFIFFRLTDIAYKAFTDSIEAQGRALLRVSLVCLFHLTRPLSFMFLAFKDLDELEVTPPQAILDHAQILREILSVYASALGDSASIHQDLSSEPMDEAGFEHILNVMVEPALQMCDAAAEEKKRVRGRWDREVFSLNCLTYLQVRVAT